MKGFYSRTEQASTDREKKVLIAGASGGYLFLQGKIVLLLKGIDNRQLRFSGKIKSPPPPSGGDGLERLL